MKVNLKINGLELFVSNKDNQGKYVVEPSKTDVTFKVEDIEISNEFTAEEFAEYMSNITKAFAGFDLDDLSTYTHSCNKKVKDSINDNWPEN